MSVSRPAALLALAACLAPCLEAATVDPVRLRKELVRLTRPGSLHGFEGRSETGARGLEHILAGRALPLSLPLKAYRLLQGRQTLEEQWLAEGSVPSPFYQDDKVVVGLGDALSTDEDGVRLITKGCFTCHAGPVGGKLVAGLPNTHLDLVPATALAASLSDRVTTQRAWPLPFVRYLRDYKAYVDEVLLPAYRHSTGRGDNTGAYGAWYMTAKIVDPEGSGIIQRRPGDQSTAEDEARLATAQLATVDPAPWWNVRFKNHAYRFWDAPGHAPTAFNFNFFIPQRHIDARGKEEKHREKLRRRAKIVGEVLHFVKETRPPRLPPEEEQALLADWETVREGERIFHGGETSTGRRQSCFRCHGSYRTEGEELVVRYPNLGLVSVGTDPSYNRVLRHLAPLAEKINRTREFYGEDLAPGTIPVTRPGYTPPVLVGAWASAPYFHNGAVPTLTDVLTPPAERPEIWARRLDSPSAYDHERGGLSVDHLTAEQAEDLREAARDRPPRSPEAIAARRVYDTREYGRSRLGHPFGTDLAPGEKAALIAFLRSLVPVEGRGVVTSAP